MVEKNQTIKQMPKSMGGFQKVDQLHYLAGLVTKVSTELWMPWSPCKDT